MSLTIISKPKNNPVADTISAAIAHYARFYRYIDTVELQPMRWAIFKEYILRVHDGEIEIRDEVHFHDIKVKKGSKLMLDPMKITLKPSLLDPSSLKKEDVNN